jgi:hypothetical protein
MLAAVSDSSDPRSALVGAGFALVLCVACSSDPEVVATSVKGGVMLPDIPTISECQAGVYKGSFYADQESPLPLSGPLEFSLVQSRQGEFLELGPNTKLEGRDPDTRTEFTADVVTEACVAGAYETKLVNGKFSLLDPDGQPVPDFTYPFEGNIKGEYLASAAVFYGTWDTITTGLLQFKGGWVAQWYQSDGTDP